MRISERQKNFLTALHNAFESRSFETRAVNARLAGLALKEPCNVELLKAIRPSWEEPYEVEYHVGTEARMTRATQASVENYLAEIANG